jgi:RNA polymerase sigma-32 factor
MASITNSLPTLKGSSVKSGERGFLQYLQQIQKFPILTAAEEFEYGSKFAKTGDKEAARMLIQSHLRLVVKMARKFKNYGLPAIDLVSEGNLGLMQAVKKFDPQKGFRFATYAMWWIRAYMQDYILRSWSLVKIGTTVAQKKLFFNLHKIKKKLNSANDKALSPQHVEQIASDLNVSKKEVVEMNSRLFQSDTSLNNLVGDQDDSIEMVDLMASADASQEEISIENQEKSRQEIMFKKAFAHLSEREQDILAKRQMSENPLTLEELSQIYQVSRERIRQIEENAINKIKKEVAKFKKQ